VGRRKKRWVVTIVHVTTKIRKAGIPIILCEKGGPKADDYLAYAEALFLWSTTWRGSGWPDGPRLSPPWDCGLASGRLPLLSLRCSGSMREAAYSERSAHLL